MVLISEHVPLAPMTNMKVGGSARYFAQVSTKDEWEEVVRFAREGDLPMMVLGGGNNLVFPDAGIEGVVLRMTANTVDFLDGRRVRAEAGVQMGTLIGLARGKSCFGLEGFIGIPGTVGAAIRGNIGIPGCEIRDVVLEVEVWTGERFEVWTRDECGFGYRTSRIKDEQAFVWAATLLLADGASIDADEQMKKRLAGQPKGKSCGSFFKNPGAEHGVSAGALVEQCGLKGRRIGGAFVSEKHANWLMNDGTATADDVIALAREVRNIVHENKGVLLVPEVIIYNTQGQVIRL